MTGKILVLEGDRMDRLIVVLEWCRDELHEEMIDLVGKGLSDTSQFEHLEMAIRDLVAVLIYLRGSKL